MSVESLIRLLTEVSFPILLAAGLVMWVAKSSEKRETRMWDTIKGFNNTLGKFDNTLKDVAIGLYEVKKEVNTVKEEVKELREIKDK